MINSGSQTLTGNRSSDVTRRSLVTRGKDVDVGLMRSPRST